VGDDVQIRLRADVLAPSCEIITPSDVAIKLRDLTVEELKAASSYIQLESADIGGKYTIQIKCSNTDANGKAYFSMNAQEADMCIVGSNEFTCSDLVNKTVGISPRFGVQGKSFHFYNNAKGRAEVIALNLKDNMGELWISGARVGAVKDTLPMPGSISADFTVRIWSD
jgi:hypothetical protein